MWNHRIVRTKADTSHIFWMEGDPTEVYEIAEVYYDADGTPYTYGRPFMHGDNVDELKNTVSRLGGVFDKPILNYPEDFKEDDETAVRHGE